MRDLSEKQHIEEIHNHNRFPVSIRKILTSILFLLRRLLPIFASYSVFARSPPSMACHPKKVRGSNSDGDMLVMVAWECRVQEMVAVQPHAWRDSPALGTT